MLLILEFVEPKIFETLAIRFEIFAMVQCHQTLDITKVESDNLAFSKWRFYANSK